MNEDQENIIASLAILMVNWDADHRADYLHPFSEMLAEVVSRSTNRILAAEDLQTEYKRMFGVRVPVVVISNLLRRLERRKYISRKDHHYVPNRSRLKTRRFAEVRESVLEDYDLLIERFVEYNSEIFDNDITRSEAEEYVEGFLAEHQFVLLNALITKTEPALPLQSSRTPGGKYVMGCFVMEIAKSRSREFKCLETVLKGMMLVNSLYLPDNKTFERRWSTAFYFDTPFLMESLGYQGLNRRELREEQLQVLHKRGAKSKCFTHNVYEVKNICQSSFTLSRAAEAPRFTVRWSPQSTSW